MTVSPVSSTAAPTLIADRYELLEQIGKGSSAVVYAAIDRRFDRRVTVKLFAPAIGSDPALRARFQQQSAKAGRLTHPNIAAILDAGLTDEAGAPRQPYVVQEPAGHETLGTLLRRRGHLTSTHAASIVRQVAAALQHAHDRGIMHANVKPDNVVLDASGTATLVDFSLSFVSAQTGAVTRETLGRRAAYLAPEQVRGDEVGPSADVYALGVLFYEMLVGRPPFIGESPQVVAERRIHESARPAGLYDPSVPPAIEALIGRALDRRPENRWPSVAAFVEALDGLQAEQLQPREPDDLGFGDTDLSRRHRTRLPGRMASLGALVPLLAVVLALGLVVAYLVPMLRGMPRIGGLFSGTSVPNVVGMAVPDARRVAEERGLEFIVVGDRVSDRAPQGQIVQQAPVAGRETTGQPLRVTVSAGVSVPDVRGKSLENATEALRELGWRVARTERHPSPGHASGTVVVQHPAPGDVAPGPGEMLLAVAE